MTEADVISSFLDDLRDKQVAADQPAPLPIAQPDLDPELLAATPSLNQYFDEMCQALADRRVIIVRRGGTITFGSLFAILGALLFHALAAVLVYVLWKLVIAAPWIWTPSHNTLSDSGGRPGTSFTMLGEGEYTGTNTDPYLGPLAPPQTGSLSTTVPPALPNIEPWTVPGAQPSADAAPLIGVPTSLAPPTIKPPQVAIRPGAAPQTNLPAGPLVLGPHASPVQPDQPALGVRGTALATGTASIARIGPHPGGQSDDGDDEPTINIMNGHHGTGTGSGNGNGEGVDRGDSGANNETPGLLTMPTPSWPIKQMVTPTHGLVIYDVMVLADGTPGEIKLIQSCGDPTIDAVCRTAASEAKFRPAYRNGKPFAAPFRLEWGSEH